MRVVGTTIAAAICAAGLAIAIGQQDADALSDARVVTVSSVVREISDPATGERWLLEHDPAVPGGPGRLVRAATDEDEPKQTAGAQSRNEKAWSPCVVRAGDRVIVEEHTTVMDAELEGVALNGAQSGMKLRVRLKIGGKIVNVVAQGPGRVAIPTAAGVQP